MSDPVKFYHTSFPLGQGDVVCDRHLSLQVQALVPWQRLSPWKEDRWSWVIYQRPTFSPLCLVLHRHAMICFVVAKKSLFLLQGTIGVTINWFAAKFFRDHSSLIRLFITAFQISHPFASIRRLHFLYLWTLPSGPICKGRYAQSTLSEHANPSAIWPVP